MSRGGWLVDLMDRHSQLQRLRESKESRVMRRERRREERRRSREKHEGGEVGFSDGGVGGGVTGGGGCEFCGDEGRLRGRLNQKAADGVVTSPPITSV